MWDKLDKTREPNLETVNQYVNSALWDALRSHLESTYRVKPAFAYSGCSMQPGWNLKYRKRGRALCTVYPMEGYVISLVVIGEREVLPFESMLSSCSEYLRTLYAETKQDDGTCWLMIELKTEETYKDIERLLTLRTSA